MATVKVGIIGLGVGSWHLKSFGETKGARVVALCDVDGKRLAKKGKEHGIKRLYRSWKDLLADESVDAVSVCVPNVFHGPISIAALAAGKHVLCEKPLSDTLAGAKKILRAAAKAKRTFMIAMKLRYLPESAYIRSLLDKGKFGFVYHGYSHYLRPLGGVPARPTFIHRRLSGGGALIDNGVHLLDLNWYLMGCPRPVAAFGTVSKRLVNKGMGFGMSLARAKALRCNVEDFGAGMIRFANGATIYLDNSWASFVPEKGVSSIRILGDSGGATVWPFSVTLSKGLKVVDATPDLSKKKFRAPTQFKHFIDCVRGDSNPLSTAEQGVQMMQMLDGIYRSSRTGKAVKIS
jgi:predicted dehydrogenase